MSDDSSASSPSGEPDAESPGGPSAAAKAESGGAGDRRVSTGDAPAAPRPASPNGLSPGTSGMEGIYQFVNVVFDRLEVFWEGERVRRATANLLILVFLGTLIVIEAKRQGVLPEAVGHLVPTSHFGAVSMAFTFFLILEIIGLVFALARSVANAVGKQFEIFSLILLREAFKEFSNFGEPIQWEAVRQPVYHMMADALGALLIFVVIAFYYRVQEHRRITTDREDEASFVAAKKLIALVLLLTFAGIGIHDLTLLLSGGTPYPFFKTFYTVLVFSDVLIVLLSLRYTATYHVVFRNSGFALGTVALRIALAAPPYVNAAIGFGASLFVLGLTSAHNRFGAYRYPEEEDAPPGEEVASDAHPAPKSEPEQDSTPEPASRPR